MLNSRRSASVGALPAEKKHFVSRTESASGASLDVRCACQFFMCDSLLPERVNPVDSRPSSRQAQHSEDCPQHDELSLHSFEIVSHADVAPSVDLSFMERYPELEQTAKSRGLVVRSISDATTEQEPMAVGAHHPGMAGFMAGRRRQLSMGGLSTGSAGGGRFGGDSLSMRSGTSLRRITAGYSKTDLYCADINIPRRESAGGQRSASASRRTSNADLFQATILPGSMQPPQLNLIAATPTPGIGETAPQFGSSHQSSPAPGGTGGVAAAHDFRNAKPPLSTDYMRPSEANKERVLTGDTLPQNRPIDVSRFAGDAVRPSALYEADLQPLQNPYQPTVKPIDPLAETVAELEQIAQEHNIVNIRDNIQTQTRRPPSIASELSAKPLQLDELTKIEIVSAIPVVDIDALLHEEEQKAVEHRSRSPRPTRRPKSPPMAPLPQSAAAPMSTLQLPSSRPGSPATQTQAAAAPAAPLKRQHTPERQLSPERPNKWQPRQEQLQSRQEQLPRQEQLQPRQQQLQQRQLSPERANNWPPMQQETPPEEAAAKGSYTSRFKSMFSSKQRDKSPTPQRSRSPSPSPATITQHREKSPSPSRMLSVFNMGKPQAMSMVTSGAGVMKRQEAEPLSVRVTETFSLKVDDMDQYNPHPAKSQAPPPPPAHAQTLYSSREDFAASERNSERISMDISEAFAPVVVSAVPRGTLSSFSGSLGSGGSFMAGNRNLYSSEIEMPSTGSEQFRSSSSKEPSMVSHGSHGSRPLISVPIQIGAAKTTPARLARTQSHDRGGVPSAGAGAGGVGGVRPLSGAASQEQLLFGSAPRMTKTVSFNFDERKSRLADFESSSISPLTQKQSEHRDFLERTYFSRDHDYEPVGVAEALAQPEILATPSTPTPMDIDVEVSSAGTATPRTESRTDYEIHTSQVDSSALEELPLQPENRKKSFMASAQDRTRKMQDGLRNQAGKLRTKLRTQPKPKRDVSGSPKAKAKERRRFAPEFAKLKMPELKLKELKRPEFTKFQKPDMSKFKLPEKLTTLKLRRSKSFKENEGEPEEPEAGAAQPAAAPKKKFEFNFGTYPRAFRKKKTVEEPPVSAMDSSLGTERLSLSVIPSTETQPSQTSTSSPQGDRGPGPVRSRWADKFSDVSYNDSEGSRYRRYGSELESFDRESSLERRMKDDLETEDTTSGGGQEDQQQQQEQTQLGILSGVADSKQFAEFDEENRAIHEISSQRTREFKRRPMVHQDSDLRSEDSRDAEGWTEKDIQKNKLLRKAELDAEASYHYKYQDLHQDAQSTASSGKKVVMEHIDDDEFFLRKRGISEDNIQLRQYISEAIREGYEMPNALQHVGHGREQEREQQELEEEELRQLEQQQYGDYDVPPPKPRRVHRAYRPELEDSQEFQRSEYGDDLSMSQNGSDFLPKRPLRKARSRSKYSIEGSSQDIPMQADGSSSIQYFDDDEDYLRPPSRQQLQQQQQAEQSLNNLGSGTPSPAPRPQAPRRQKKRTREEASVEKEHQQQQQQQSRPRDPDADSFINGFGGRSVSNTFLQPQEDVIVYRTEHEYHHHIPLATPDNFTDGASARSILRSEDERTSRGAESLVLDIHGKPEQQLQAGAGAGGEQQEKYIIDMLESDGYAVVRKEQLLPKPTPPARRKKFTRLPGEQRFATLPNMRGSRGSPPPARPPPPKEYTPSEDSPLQPRSQRHRRSLEELPTQAQTQSPLLLVKSNYATQSAAAPAPEEEEEDDYEEPQVLHRLQSDEVTNKMKFRPLPPPPRPPREKRSARGGSSNLDSYEDSERGVVSSASEQGEFEVEVSTQTDPLPDDFVCEEFEITEDMKVIEPRRSGSSTAGRPTLEDVLRSVTQGQEQDEIDGGARGVLSEDEQLARGLQRFRDANQRSMSERSRASSQADRSKSLSRPQTPSSAVIIERRVPTPSLSAGEADDTVQAALIVRPISAADLADEELRREEEELRREGLLSDSSVQSKSDVETAGEEEEQAEAQALSDYAASSADLDAAVEQLQLRQAQLLESDYDSKLEDDEVERTLRDSEYSEEEEQEDAGEKYSDQYSEEEQTQRTEQQLDEALEKELKEEMEKMLAEYRKTEAEEEERLLSDLEEVQEAAPPAPAASSEPTEAEVSLQFVATLPTEPAADIAASYSQETLPEEEETPLPPPRRRSTTALEPSTSESLTIVEQQPSEVTALQSTAAAQLPTHLQELEVERLRVHALQAGQIQVSQLHGAQISADELACKSGQLVVQNIELPPGFIEDIVERVKEQRPSLLTTETQTSRQPSSEPAVSDVEPPVKPPRQTKGSETAPTAAAPAVAAAAPHSNLDEQTQTEAALLPLPPPPAVYPSVEYLQSLAPLAFYNLQRSAEAEQAEAAAGGGSAAERKAPHKCRRRHLAQEKHDSESELEEQLVERPRSRSRRSRTRSATQPIEDYDEDQPKTVVQAGRQFISACSLELVNIINQLTNFVRGDAALEPAQQPRNISALMMLFILITFGVLVFLLTGRQVHTHHWDYFNPPGNEGRQT